MSEETDPAAIIAEATHEAIDAALAPVLKRLAEIDAKFSTLEERGIRYRGVWQAADEYARGDVATSGGALWIANVATRAKPGDTSAAWTLAVKAGRDGKDAGR